MDRITEEWKLRSLGVFMPSTLIKRPSRPLQEWLRGRLDWIGIGSELHSGSSETVWHYRDYLHVLYYIILWRLFRECFNPPISNQDKRQDDQHLELRLQCQPQYASDELFNLFSPSELRHNGTVLLPGGITLNGTIISIRMLQRAVSTPSARDAKWNLRAALFFTGRRVPLTLFLRLTFSCRSTAYSLVKKASHYDKRMFLL